MHESEILASCLLNLMLRLHTASLPLGNGDVLVLEKASLMQPATAVEDAMVCSICDT